VLDRLTLLLEAIARRSVYLTLLVERPAVLEQLIDLCAASVWIAEHLTRYPLLLDDLLDPRTLYSPLDRRGLRTELARDLARVSAEDAEQVLEALRYFKQSNVLRVAAADVTGALPLMRVSDNLTEIAEALVGKVLELAWRDLEPRFGRPHCRVNGTDREAGLAIVAYGKLGGIELGYGSDLDLVFLHDSSGERQQTTGPREIDNMTFFTRLTQRVIHMLTARTGAGVLYEVDTRLRPSGRSGLLVSSIDAFATYQREQAWTWEHQALVRARAVAGPPSLVARFDEIRRQVLSQPRDPGMLRREVCQMRDRMREALDSGKPGWFHIKQGRGGIADIEFMVQYSVMANAQRYPALLRYSDNIRQLDGLEHVGILTSADATLLRDAYRTFRRRSHLLKLQEQSSLIPDSELQNDRQNVIRIWRTLMEDETSRSSVSR
jgi:glutamate-ammonia-ligase adenylyltransferase